MAQAQPLPDVDPPADDYLPRSISRCIDWREECKSQTGSEINKGYSSWQNEVRWTRVDPLIMDRKLIYQVDAALTHSMWDQLKQQLLAPLSRSSKTKDDDKDDLGAADAFTSLTISSLPTAQSLLPPPATRHGIWNLFEEGSWKQGRMWKKWKRLNLPSGPCSGTLSIDEAHVQGKFPGLKAQFELFENRTFDLQGGGPTYRLRRLTPFVGFVTQDGKDSINLEFKWHLQVRAMTAEGVEAWDSEEYTSTWGETWNKRVVVLNIHCIKDDHIAAQDVHGLERKIIDRLRHFQQGLNVQRRVLADLTEPHYVMEGNGHFEYVLNQHGGFQYYPRPAGEGRKKARYKHVPPDPSLSPTKRNNSVRLYKANFP